MKFDVAHRQLREICDSKCIHKEAGRHLLIRELSQKTAETILLCIFLGPKSQSSVEQTASLLQHLLLFFIC